MQDSPKLSGEKEGLQPKTECFAPHHGEAFLWPSQEGRELVSQQVIGNSSLSSHQAVIGRPSQRARCPISMNISLGRLGQKASVGSDK